MSVCSPSASSTFSKDRTCFDKQALLRLADSWNRTHPENRIANAKSMSKSKLWAEINRRMMSKCKGEDKEACWVDHLAAKDDPVQKKLRPVSPREWKKNPYTWLTNYDIEDALFQYEDDKKFQFKFIGVFPVDFAVETGIFGKCLYQETCDIDFRKLRRKGYKYAGMVINLDTHDQPGSHWTALFIVMDPTSPSYGAYYYDSVARRPPEQVDAYMKLLKKKAQEADPHKEFKLQYNMRRHQLKNSECGIFSMSYLVRWLVLLQGDPATPFEKVVKIKARDENIHKMRRLFFREKSI